MSVLILISKTLLIIFFLVMFLRTNKPAWGIGLLTVTSAILLDTFLSTLGREQMLDELGFFFYIIAGALVAGAAIWLWAILREFAFPHSAQANESTSTSLSVDDESSDSGENEIVEQRPIYEEMVSDLVYDDLLDLIFDLGWAGEDVREVQGRNEQLVNNIIILAEDRGQMEQLQLAIQRIKTPIPPDKLPRLEKLNQDSPPTVLRHYLLSHYSLIELNQLVKELAVDGDDNQGYKKKEKVRYLLTRLYETNHIDALIKVMQADDMADSSQTN